MGIEYVSVTAEGTAKDLPRFCTAYAMKKMVLRYLILREEYRGGDHFATHFTQNSEAQLAIKNLDLDGLMSCLEVYKLVSPQLRAQNAVSSAASARQLQKFTQTLNVGLKGQAAFSVLENLVGSSPLACSITFGMVDDDGPSGSTPLLNLGPSAPVPVAGPAALPVVALFIPADVLAMSDNKAADYFDQQLASAVKNDQTHQVFTVLAMWTKMAYSRKRLAKDGSSRPMLARLKQAIERLLSQTPVANCLVVRPAKPDPDNPRFLRPENLHVSDQSQRMLAQSVCRTDKGNGGLAYAHSRSLSKAQRAAIDFCLTRFVNMAVISRWPETLFQILKAKFFPTDKSYTRDNAHTRDEAVAWADSEFFAKVPTGSADSPATLVLAWTRTEAPSPATRNKAPLQAPLQAPKPRKKAKARVGAEAAAKAAADTSATTVPPASAPPSDAGAATPTANSPPPPPNPKVAARLDAIAAKLADLQAQEVAYQQNKHINAVAVATATMTVDQLKAQAMGTPAGSQSPRPPASHAPQAPQSADEVEAASRMSAITDIQAELRAHGR